MEFLVGIVVVAAVVFGIWWAHRAKALAHAGVSFDLPAPPDEVAAAVRRAFCDGARAKVQGSMSILRVEQAASRSFITSSKWGDQGLIQISASGTGSTVTAHAEQLHIGSNVKDKGGCGCLWSLSNVIVDSVWRMLGIAPSAGKIHRFHGRLEARLRRQLQRKA